MQLGRCTAQFNQAVRLLLQPCMPFGAGCTHAALKHLKEQQQLVCVYGDRASRASHNHMYCVGGFSGVSSPAQQVEVCDDSSAVHVLLLVLCLAAVDALMLQQPALLLRLLSAGQILMFVAAAPCTCYQTF
jgi:hypothetical protein